MRKLKAYIETSIVNFAISDQSPDYKEATLQFLESLKEGEYEGYISEIVLREIRQASEDKAAQLLNILQQFSLEELEVTEEIEDLANQYVQAGLIPGRYINDALHIALATCYDLDIIMTWNFEHMVKLKTKKGVISVNALNGYKPIEIISPLEVN